MGKIVKVYEEPRVNTVEYVADLALQFKYSARAGGDDIGVGPTDATIVSMGLRLLAAQLPSQAAFVLAEAMASAIGRL